MALTEREAALFAAHPPAGVILFGRNVQEPGQLRSLLDNLRAVLPPNAALMVDQEGGRVARLRPPHWGDHPPAGAIGAVYEHDPAAGLRAAWLSGALIGCDCRDAGFTIAAAPVLDLRVPGAHDVVGDRAFAAHPADVARMGRAFANGLLAAGIVPVAKHAPGHGRATVDSHLSLPVTSGTEWTVDARPFVLNRDLPWMMTAHLVYQALDPDAPATLSSRIIKDVLRDHTGFGGVLVSDDLAMKALSGEPADLAMEALAAGCDIALYCSGQFDTTEALLRRCSPLTPAAQDRIAAGWARAEAARLSLDPVALRQERAKLLS